MDPLEQALQLNDEACAIIQELVAQLQAKEGPKDLDKKAETLAAKSGVSFDEASAMIKEASEKGSDVDLLIKRAEKFVSPSFGKVAEDVNESIEKYASAEDKFKAREAELMLDLGLIN